MTLPRRKLFLYLVSQKANTSSGAYTQMVVTATSAANARKMHPLQSLTRNREEAWKLPAAKSFWCESPEQTYAKILGDTTNRFRIPVVITPVITLQMFSERNKSNEL